MCEDTQLFYVPVVLVLHAKDEGDADGRAESLMTNVASLLPAGMDGFTLVTGLSASPASPNWDTKVQEPVIDHSRVVIGELTA